MLAVSWSGVGAARTLWQLGAPAGATGKRVAAKVVRPEAMPLRIDAGALSGWAVGEVADMPLSGGRTVALRARRIETHPSGNRTWVGEVSENGRTYVTLITAGDAGIEGEMRVPNGHFVLATTDTDTLLIDTEASGWRPPVLFEPDAGTTGDDAAEEALDKSSRLRSKVMSLEQASVGQATIDVLIAYTHAMVTRFGSTAGVQVRLDHLIATANQAYIDSQVLITLRLVHTVEALYPDANANSAALNDLSNNIGALGPIQSTMRARYGADIVALVRPFSYASQYSCGIAWVGGFGGNGDVISEQPGDGFAVISDGVDVNGTNYFCQGATFPHELGHIMGAMHDRATTTRGGVMVPAALGAYSYSYGY
ncbi:MAG: reprolysin-like metallopeptidase, partial [Betaproteobacteria bacterium]